MKIIDAHIHYQPENVHFDRLAQSAGHENTERHLREAFAAADIECAIVMGGRGLMAGNKDYPDFLHYCFGVHRDALEPESAYQAIAQAELHLQKKDCVGLKIYAGYTFRELCDPVYAPFYQLAEKYDKPVAVHTGVTASSNALLHYSHPLQLDAAAVEFPGVRFVMCHFGNPWLMDAAAVLEKNTNISADLSGLLVGQIDVEGYLRKQRGYVEQLKTWIAYVDDYGKFMYGTDWPLAGIDGYIGLTKEIIPQEHWDAVFYENARRVYGLK